jgi:molybdate transport system substrate-binding protein
VLGNTLVLITPADRRRTVDLRQGVDLAGMLGGDRLATGDPAHVPVGRYAQQALTALGIWDAVGPKLARADNVRAALLLVERGEAPFGIVYGTDAAVAPRVAVAGTFPPTSHEPIRYPFAIVAKRDRPAVQRFFAFMIGPEAREIYRKAGFAVLDVPR